MNNTSIRRNDFITLNVDVKTTYINKYIPAGTRCRVWKASRNGMISVSPEGNYTSLYINKNLATKVDAPRAEVKIGDIFVSSGGYEQTNITFYRITSVKTAIVEIVEIDSNRKYTDHMCGEIVPDLQSVGHNRKIVLIRVNGNGTVSFKGIWGYTFPWDGKPCFFSEWH